MAYNSNCIEGSTLTVQQTADLFETGSINTDGDIYNFNNHNILVIGGAYSVDKYFRLAKGYNWYEREQPSEKTKKKIKKY